MATGTDLRLGGFVPLSTVDWPDALVATVFTRGCPWDCPYCHNPHLRHSTGGGTPTWGEVRDFLRSRVGLLDGVVFSGGEPTVQFALTEAMAEIRGMGLSVGLHTGGPDTARLARALEFTGWVGFDVKAPFDRYESVTRVPGSGDAALAGLRMALGSASQVEVRTTVHPDLLTPGDLACLADRLREEGVERWVLQRYRPEGTRGLLPHALIHDEDILSAVTGGPGTIVVR